MDLKNKEKKSLKNSKKAKKKNIFSKEKFKKAKKKFPEFLSYFFKV